jgi:two-component system NarL family response regulator
MPLTERELDVLRLIARGLSSIQVGAARGIAESTVKNHRRHIYLKIGVHTEVEATVWYVRNHGDPDSDEREA